MDKTPRPGDLYRHDSNKIVQIIAVATYAETNEQLVVYQEMSGSFHIYAKPLTEFIRETDRENHLQAVHDYKTETEKLSQDQPAQTVNTRTWTPSETKRAFRQDIAETSGTEAAYSKKRSRQIEEREHRRGLFRKPEKRQSAKDELHANPNLMKFLDASTYEEKYQVLVDIQEEMTDRLIDDIAVVLDVVIPEGSLNDRYSQLQNILLTRQKYESNRFRR